MGSRNPRSVIMEHFDTIVLLSGGLDSGVILADAVSDKKKVMAISFDYCQRHRQELHYAKKLAHHYGVKHLVLKIDPQAFGQSSLVTQGSVPKNRTLEAIIARGQCSTYVPARNTIFLSYAFGQAEMHQIKEICFGPNANDAPCFSDCTEEYVAAFQNLIRSTGSDRPKIVTPLIKMNKKQIVERAIALNLPIDKTLSCYDPLPNGEHCRQCDACVIRFDALSKAQGECVV